MNNNPLPPIKRLTMAEAHYIDHVCRIQVDVIGRILFHGLLKSTKAPSGSGLVSRLKKFFTLKTERKFTETQLNNVQKMIHHCTTFLSCVMSLASITRRIDMGDLTPEEVSGLERRYTLICEEIEVLYNAIKTADYGNNRYIDGAFWQIHHLYHEALRP